MTRRGPRTPASATRSTGWALGVLAAAEVALGGLWVTTGTTLLVVLGEALLLALLALTLVCDRYLRFRRAFERDIALRAVQHERSQLAEDLHDVLGHELSLIAIRAGALQVSTTGRAAEQAADLRGQVEQAVVQLRQTVRLLNAESPAHASVEPATLDVEALVSRAQAAGVAVTTVGQVRAEVPAPVRLTAYRFVQECLTNAAKHAPAAAVALQVQERQGVLDITVETGGAGGDDLAPGSGLASLRRRVEAIGGVLDVRAGGDRHLTRARLPLDGAGPGTTEPAVDPLGAVAFRRPGAATLRWTLLPAGVLVAVTVAFYSWATSGATVEQEAFDSLVDGQASSQAHVLLPGRQAPVRLIPTAPAPAAWRCAYYTDGNFPLGMATFEVCDDGAELTRVSDLRKVPLR